MKAQIMQWLHEQLANAEKALRAREQIADAWRSGTDESWAATAEMHPSTAGKPPILEVLRLREALRQTRIADKCRRDVEMFKAVIAEITP